MTAARTSATAFFDPRRSERAASAGERSPHHGVRREEEYLISVSTKVFSRLERKITGGPAHVRIELRPVGTRDAVVSLRIFPESAPMVLKAIATARSLPDRGYALVGSLPRFGEIEIRVWAERRHERTAVVFGRHRGTDGIPIGRPLFVDADELQFLERALRRLDGSHEEK